MPAEVAEKPYEHLLDDSTDYDALRNGSTLPETAVSKAVEPPPTKPLPGETLELFKASLVKSKIFISQYRIIIDIKQTGGTSLPILMLESVEANENVCLLNSKMGRVFRVKAKSREAAIELFKKLTLLATHKRSYLNDIYAYRFSKDNSDLKWLKTFPNNTDFPYNEQKENKELLQDDFKRLKFTEKWEITDKNADFCICDTYPKFLIIPKSTGDLGKSCQGRFYNRFPTAIWKSSAGGVLLRSSQPKVSWLGAPPGEDVEYINTVYEAVTLPGTTNPKKLLIVDARSYAAAWANRAKGGGFESVEVYTNCDIEFMALPNIHNVRYSFSQLRLTLATADDATYFQSLQSTQWIQCLMLLLRSSIRCAVALRSGQSVLVHCSDGWDRTTQIVALVKVMSDAYYRTFKGFKYLIQRDWIEFGHKFADRNGVLNEDPNEKSPIFLQFLDCVYQLWVQNPRKFEFNQRFLIKLAQHSYSGLFGDFLFNSVKHAKAHHGIQEKETDSAVTADRIRSVWDYLHEECNEFRNYMYSKNEKDSDLFKCSTKIDAIQLWKDVYCCSDIENLVNSVIDGTENDRITKDSRSVSTSSLNDSNHGHNLTTKYNNSPSSPNFTNFNTGLLSDKQHSRNFAEFLDNDGLMKVAIEQEDELRKIFVEKDQLHKDMSKMQLSEPPSNKPSPPINNYRNGKCNGLDTSSAKSRSSHGGSQCMENNEKVPTTRSKISVK